MSKKTPKELPEANEAVENSMTENKESQELPEELEELLGEIVDEPETKEQFRLVLQKLSVKMVQGNEPPDPETLKILTSTVESENQRRFEFLMAQEKNEAAAKLREDNRKAKELEIKEKTYDNSFSITRPAIYLIFTLVGSLVIFSAYLIIVGEKEVGITLLTGIITGVLGFLAGRGVTLYQQKE